MKKVVRLKTGNANKMLRIVLIFLANTVYNLIKINDITREISAYHIHTKLI